MKPKFAHHAPETVAERLHVDALGLVDPWNIVERHRQR